VQNAAQGGILRVNEKGRLGETPQEFLVNVEVSAVLRLYGSPNSLPTTKNWRFES